MALSDIQAQVAQQVQAAYDQGVVDGKASVQPQVPVSADQVLAVLKSEEADLEGKIQALFTPPAQ